MMRKEYDNQACSNVLSSTSPTATFSLDLAKMPGALLKKAEGMRNLVLQVLLPETATAYYKIEVFVRDQR